MNAWSNPVREDCCHTLSPWQNSVHAISFLASSSFPLLQHFLLLHLRLLLLSHLVQPQLLLSRSVQASPLLPVFHPFQASHSLPPPHPHLQRLHLQVYSQATLAVLVVECLLFD